MRNMTRFAAALSLVTLAGCNSLDVTDLNNPGLESLETAPTRTAVLTATQGLLIGARAGFAGGGGYITVLGILGREVYWLTSDDPRFVTELLIGPLENGSFGGGNWGARYANIRNSNIVLNAVDQVANLSAAEKSGVKGFTKTIQALDLLLVINTRDAFGAPIDVDLPPTAPPAAIATKAEVFARIVQLLDEARTDLQAAGTTFPFSLGAGFTGFNTPATFLQVNRGLRARVAAYLADWPGVQTALQASFIDPAGDLTRGVYHVYGLGSGDAANASFDPTGRALRAHPSTTANAAQRPGGGIDQRADAKTDPAAGTLTFQGVSSNLVVSVYATNTAPVPIIRNEELILLRAEANINGGNLAAAVTDINSIRQRSGGLGPYAGPVTQAALIDELLYNRRYSLYYEGHRWIDLRRYNRLGQLPRDLATHRVFSAFPFPTNECLARGNQPAAPCTALNGTP